MSNSKDKTTSRRRRRKQVSEAAKEAAEDILGKQGKKKNNWLERECKEARANKNAARIRGIQRTAIAAVEEYKSSVQVENKIIKH